VGREGRWLKILAPSCKTAVSFIARKQGSVWGILRCDKKECERVVGRPNKFRDGLWRHLGEVEPMIVGEEKGKERGGCAAADFHVERGDGGMFWLVKDEGGRRISCEEELYGKHALRTLSVLGRGRYRVILNFKPIVLVHFQSFLCTSFLKIYRF
jgi:hypothetical protein